jgi:hypothetical protein
LPRACCGCRGYQPLCESFTNDDAAIIFARLKLIRDSLQGLEEVFKSMVWASEEKMMVNRDRLILLGTVSVILSTTAFGQEFTIWTEAPTTVEQGGTYTVEFWARVEGSPFVQDVSAIAGFGIGGFATAGRHRVAMNHGTVFADWVGLRTYGTVVGPDVIGVSGGQLASIFGVPWTDLSHPVMLFQFDVTVGDTLGRVTYTPGDPSPLGGLSFYPLSTDGSSIIAPNDPGTTLTFVGATTRVVPGSGVVAALTVACGLAGFRRRR